MDWRYFSESAWILIFLSMSSQIRFWLSSSHLALCIWIIFLRYFSLKAFESSSSRKVANNIYFNNAKYMCKLDCTTNSYCFMNISCCQFPFYVLLREKLMKRTHYSAPWQRNRKYQDNMFLASEPFFAKDLILYILVTMFCIGLNWKDGITWTQ